MFCSKWLFWIFYGKVIILFFFICVFIFWCFSFGLWFKNKNWFYWVGFLKLLFFMGDGKVKRFVILWLNLMLGWYWWIVCDKGWWLGVLVNVVIKIILIYKLFVWCGSFFCLVLCWFVVRILWIVFVWFYF